MSGFEYLAKYYYQKTGKKISFYPVFISKKKSAMYIEQAITYNPDNDSNIEKERIVKGLHDAIEKSYFIHEKPKANSL